MEFKTLCWLGAATSASFGLAFLVEPTLTAGLYGIGLPGSPTQALARFLGATYLAQAVLLWGASQLTQPAAQRRLAGGFAAITVIGLALAVQTLATGAVNAMGWLSVLIYGGFSVAWALAARSAGAGLARA